MKIIFNKPDEKIEPLLKNYTDFRPHVIYYLAKYGTNKEVRPEDTNNYYLKLKDDIYRISRSGLELISTSNFYPTDLFRELPKEFSITLSN